ncbi:MAG: sterol desaturase family protein [Cocleimonas sp.]|nr:sterol desaturase family protein [Cocleimonas sp.]
MFDQAVQLFFGDWLSAFFNPQKRIFWGYLFSSFAIALVWLLLAQRKNLSSSIKQIFSAKSWLSQSARADYFLMIINGVVMTVLSPKLLGKAAVASFLFIWLHDLFGGRALVTTELSAGAIAIAFTLFLFVLDDFARYWLHRWLHTSPLLWSFHQVHHSATTLNPFTVFRSHPIEAILFSLRGALVQGVSVATFIFFFGDKVTLVMVLGASIFTFAFNLLGSNLRHSTVPIAYGNSVEKFFMSPAQHHIHHSYAPEHIDKNFGVVFSVWDLWFGSHCHSVKDQTLSFGLKNAPNHQHSLVTLYVLPFRDAWKILAGHLESVIPLLLTTFARRDTKNLKET